MFIHYGVGKYPIYALTNWGEKDPIVEFTKELKKTGDKENWRLAKKLDPKTRIYAPVIVRGEEAQGARLWEFGKLIYEQLLGIAADEDYGDFTDITDGRDFTIEAVEDVVAGRKGVKCNIRVKPKTSAISEDAAIVGNVLSEQPDILAINKHYSFDELKDLLDKWLNPDSEEDTDAPIASSNDDEEEEDDFLAEMNKPVEQTYKLDTKAAKTSNSDKFDDLFS